MGAGCQSGPALALLAAALILGGCGAEDKAGGDRAAGDGVGLVVAGSTAQFANCGDWRRGTVPQRYATIADIRGQLTPQSSAIEESDLSDEAAYRVFQSSCATDGADQLRLYKLYARAQAFAQFSSGAGESGLRDSPRSSIWTSRRAPRQRHEAGIAGPLIPTYRVSWNTSGLYSLLCRDSSHAVGHRIRRCRRTRATACHSTTRRTSPTR